MDVTLNTPILGLRGIGPQRGALLAERGFHRVADLLQYLPFRYEDRIRFTPIAEVIPGQFYTVQARSLREARCALREIVTPCF